MSKRLTEMFKCKVLGVYSALSLAFLCSWMAAEVRLTKRDYRQGFKTKFIFGFTFMKTTA